MGKLGIYIPDKRMAEVNKWRDKFTFSRLFMDAFDAAVQREATNANRPPVTLPCGPTRPAADVVLLLTAAAKHSKEAKQ